MEEREINIRFPFYANSLLLDIYLKYSTNVKRYPCCSATPAHTTLADAPISVPFPEIKAFC